MLKIDKFNGFLDVWSEGQRITIMNKDLKHLIALLSHAALGRIAEPEEIGTMQIHEGEHGNYPEIHVKPSNMEPGMYQLSARRIA